MRLATVNISLVLFNLLPAFPMGSAGPHRDQTAVRPGNPDRGSHRPRFLFGFLGLFGNPMLILMALFLYIAASQEAALADLKDLSGSLAVSDAMMTQFCFTERKRADSGRRRSSLEHIAARVSSGRFR